MFKKHFLHIKRLTHQYKKLKKFKLKFKKFNLYTNIQFGLFIQQFEYFVHLKGYKTYIKRIIFSHTGVSFALLSYL